MLLYVFLLKDFGKLIIVLLRWLFSVDDFLAIYPESIFFPFNKMLIIHTKNIVDLLWLKFPLKFNYVPNYNMVNFLLELLVLIAPCEMLGSGAGRFCSLT